MSRPPRIQLSPTTEQHAEIERAADGLPLASWALREVLRAARKINRSDGPTMPAAQGRYPRLREMLGAGKLTVAPELQADWARLMGQGSIVIGPSTPISLGIDYGNDGGSVTYACTVGEDGSLSVVVPSDGQGGQDE